MSKFSDDTKLCYWARNPDDIMELEEDINKLVEWSNKWQMSFNVDKCSVMHIRHNNMQSNYNMSNQQLPTKDQQQDLEIITTKDLKWRKETENSCKTANRVLRFITRNFRYKNKELILPVYKSLVRPHLEHAVQFWSTHLRRNVDKIEKSNKDDSWNQKPHLLPANTAPWSHQPCTKKTASTLIEVFKYLNRFTTARARGLEHETWSKTFCKTFQYISCPAILPNYNNNLQWPTKWSCKQHNSELFQEQHRQHWA